MGVTVWDRGDCDWTSSHDIKKIYFKIYIVYPLSRWLLATSFFALISPLEYLFYDWFIVICRKLKNRVAAQTARDRKRVKMDTLEDAVAALEAANKKLRAENNTLRSQTGSLFTENKELRTKLGMPSDSAVITRKDLPFPESAALAPLPKERMGVLFQLMTHSLAFLMTLT